MVGKVLAAAAFMAMMVAGADCQAQSFDGRWVAIIPSTSDKCPSIAIHMTVNGDNIAEAAGNMQYAFHFFGKLQPDGTFDMNSPGGHASTKGSYSNAGLTIQFTDGTCGTRTAHGSRQ